MKNLIKIFIVTQFFILSLFANVFLYAPKSFVQGDPVVFTIEALGESNIQFPKIDNIDGFLVQDAGISRSYSNINGKVQNKIVKRYQFFPTKSVTLPKFKVLIDGKEHFTNIYKIYAQKVIKTKSDYFDLTAQLSKNEVYVGESLVLKLIFKYRKDVRLDRVGLNPPTFENFWSKQLKNSKQYEKDNYVVQELDYLLFAQKKGILSIAPMSVDVLVIDGKNNDPFAFFNNTLKKVRIFSNELNVNVKALPENVSLFGNFILKTSVDKQSLTEGEALSYKIEVEGEGNIEDIPEFKLDLPNATIYENKPEIKTQVDGTRYLGSYSKTFSIVPTQSFTLKALKLSFFNSSTNKVQTEISKAYNITVNGAVSNATVPQKTLEKKETQNVKVVEKIVEKNSIQNNAIYFILGVINALLMLGLYKLVITQRRKKKEEEQPLVKRIKIVKDVKELEKVLLPFVYEYEVIKEWLLLLSSRQEPLKRLQKEIILLIQENQIKDK